jgi:hypothetical protein
MDRRSKRSERYHWLFPDSGRFTPAALLAIRASSPESADLVLGIVAMLYAKKIPFLPVALVALLAAGCASSPPEVKIVRGKVTYNGEPLAHADLEITPETDLNLGAFGGQTDSEGAFDIELGKGTGRHAKPGKFLVLITKGSSKITGIMPGAGGTYGILPEKYAIKSSTPFHIDLAVGINELETLKMEGPPLKK